MTSDVLSQGAIRMIPLDPGLLRTICTNPADDVPRLLAADWWDDHGEHGRAEFIRVQCELASCKFCTRVDGRFEGPAVPCSQHVMTHRREQELGDLRSDWLVPLVEALGFKAKPTERPYRYEYHGTQGIHYGGINLEVKFRRGFVHTVRCSFAEWCGLACGNCTMDFQMPVNPGCPTCHGTGRVGALGPQIVAVQAVEVFEATDEYPTSFVFPWGGSSQVDGDDNRRKENNRRTLEWAREERDRLWNRQQESEVMWK